MVPYPREWAPTAAGNGHCMHFTGDYLNAGSTVEPSNPMLPLSEAGPPDYLARIFLHKSGGAYRVRLDVSEQDRILVSEIDADGNVTAQSEAPPKDFRCSGGKIHFSEGGGIAAGGLVAVGGSSWSSISKAKDGALIVENTMWAAGVAIAVPVAMAGRSWSRFSVWTDTSKAQPVTEDPYEWPEQGRGGPAPLLLRTSPLAYSALRADAPHPYIKGIDCRAVLGDAVVSAMSSVRSALEQVQAAQIVQDEVLRLLAGSKVPVETVRSATETGEVAAAKKVIVADVHVRFGQVNQAKCVVKLVATAEVRVQPVGRAPTAAPLYDVWSIADNVPVEAWASDPGAAQAALAGLLQQVGRDLAVSYRERTRCSGVDC